MLVVLFDGLSAFLPGLDPDLSIRATRRHIDRFREHLPRRVVAAALTTVLLVGTAPAQAQVPNFDYAAWIQRAQAAATGMLNFASTETAAYWRFIRQIQASYADYQWFRAQAARLNGNVTVGLAQMLPLLPLRIKAVGRNTTETMVLRPTLAPEEKFNAPHFHVNFQHTDLSALLSMLRFDVTTERTPTEDTSKTPEQIMEDAASEGWLMWQRVQTASGVDSQYQNIPNPEFPADPYSTIPEAVKNAMRQRLTTLTDMAADAASLYGEDDAQTVELRTAAADLQAEMDRPQGIVDVQALIQRLHAIDDRAQTAVERYQYYRTELGLQAKREKAQDDNIAELSDSDTDDYKPFSLVEFMEGQATKITGAGAKRKDDAKARELSKMQGATQAQSYRLELSKGMMEELGKLQVASQDKARAISGIDADQQKKLAATQLSALQAKLGITTKAYACSEPVEELRSRGMGATLPPDVAPSLNVDSTKTPEQRISANTQIAVDKAKDDILDVFRGWQTDFKPTGTGVLRAIFQALDDGWRSATGKSLRLTDWRWTQDTSKES